MLLTLLVLGLSAQTYEVHRAPSKIVVDGKPDEAAWSKAATTELHFPWEQAGAKQKTIVRLLWDNDYLYAAYDCDDADVVAHFDQRDDPTYRDDAVELFLNPNPKQTYYYGLEMNAKGTLYDYFYAWPQLLLARLNFTGVHLATHVRGTLNSTSDTDKGWTLEVAIPWKNFEELTKTLDKSLHTRNDVEVEDRMRVYNLIRDLTADTYGGWELVTTLAAGGGLAAQRIVTMREYDLEGAKDAARAAAGIR